MSSFSTSMYGLLAIIIVVLVFGPWLSLLQLIILGTVVSVITVVVVPKVAESLFKRDE